ncbi:MAG: gamma-glutamyl-gamma-aminobutyrate hydrolase family protein [Bacteroidales bacterium]|nr:gamma-glutamyl-gamma-aminobutyrate hydrolase family protein [Bacteroidales bacterium]
MALSVMALCVGANAQLVVGIAETRGETSASVGRTYVDAVARGGHVPVIIPDSPQAEKLMEGIDVLLLIGGGDVEPSRYGEETLPQCGTIELERDAFEYRLIDEAMRLGKPIFGICRGMQILNVYFGGTLYQDIPSQYKTTINHRNGGDNIGKITHCIRIEEGSRLRETLGTECLGVNSSHHQAVKDVAPVFRVSALSTDGIIEGIESDTYNIAAVQFHPERLAIGDDTVFTALFKSFLLAK